MHRPLHHALCLSALALAAGLAQAAPVQFAGNGHWYEFVSAPATWDGAAAGAAGMSHLGMQGYLATVTNQAEQDFIHLSVSREIAWIGATDRKTEGEWRWETGPEAGTLFYKLGTGTLTYSFWSAGEPNNCCGGENDAVINWGGGGEWNDIGTPSFPNYMVGYIVEYGGVVPEPQTYALLALGLAVVGGVARRRMR